MIVAYLLQVFYNAKTCYGLVNIKPILPGHVLVIPYRLVKRLTDLTTEEVTDLFTTVQMVQKMLAKQYFRDPASGSFGKVEGGRYVMT
jgi:bis(5'-adenosyl)-triphosphatase